MAKNSYTQLDYWSKKAASEGYPARSVYKLQEINDKFKILKESYRVLDLGAAPGSWTTYVLRFLKNTGYVTAIDLAPLAKDVVSQNLSFFQGDLYSPVIQEKVKNLGPYDLVICDAAPATTGNKLVDISRSEGLVELALYYAKSMLKSNGNCVIKIFQGGNQQEITRQMKQDFSSVKMFKPKACRSESFETYLIGFGKN